MRKFLFILAVISASIFISCKKDPIFPKPEPKKPEPVNPQPGPEPVKAEADYTVLFYGVGGGTLDLALYLSLFQEVVDVKSSDKLNFVALSKFSKKYQTPTSSETKFDKDENGFDVLVSVADSLKGTFYLTKNAQGFKVQNYGKADLPFYEPKTLTEFINKATEEYKAKNYILVLWDHGSCFDEDDVVLTKSMISDDNVEHGMISIHAIERGVQDSNIKKFSMIYADMCLTNTIETLYQFKSITDYFLGSANLVPTEGGDFKLFLNGMIEGNDFIESCKSFMNQNTKIWDQYYKHQRKYMDIVLSDLRQIDPVVKSFKTVSTRYIELYKNNEANKNVLDTLQLNGYREIKFRDTSDNMISKWDNPGKFYFYNCKYAEITAEVYTNTEPATLLNNIAILPGDSNRNGYTSTDLFASFATMNVQLKDDELKKDLEIFEKDLKSMIVHKVEINVPKLWENIYHASIGLKWVSKRRAEGFYPMLDVKDEDLQSTIFEVYPKSRFGEETNWHSYFSLFDVSKEKGLQIYSFTEDNKTEPVFSDENLEW